MLCVKLYMGGAAVAPKTGKSSSSPGLLLFMVLTVREREVINHSLQLNY